MNDSIKRILYDRRLNELDEMQQIKNVTQTIPRSSRLFIKQHTVYSRDSKLFKKLCSFYVPPIDSAPIIGNNWIYLLGKMLNYGGNMFFIFFFLEYCRFPLGSEPKQAEVMSILSLLLLLTIFDSFDRKKTELEFWYRNLSNQFFQE